VRRALKSVAPNPGILAGVLAVALGAILLGCSALGPALEKPEVYLLRVTPLESTLFEQRVETEFRLRNPNEVDLAITGLDLAVDVNGTRLARVLSSDAVTVPRFGEAKLTATASTSTLDVLRQIAALGRTQEPSYEISGYVYVGDRFRRRLRLDTSGRLSAP
jgi:LEA14-like dessication related protein